MKRALGIDRRRLLGWETCHVWPKSCYDVRYHTAPANLVLLPRAIAGLTDHDPDVLAALQFRAFELYGWHPEEVPPPPRPPGYPETWRPTLPFREAALRGVARRGADGADDRAITLGTSGDRRDSGQPLLHESAGGPSRGPAVPGRQGDVSSGADRMSLEERRFVEGRIARWAERPESKVHKIVALVVRACERGGIDRDELAELAESLAGSRNGYGAVAQLLTSKGNAYGRALIERAGKITIHPDVLARVRTFRWVAPGAS